jgi:hypothetical protein
MIMKIQFPVVNTIAACTAAVGLSVASIISCGSAHANGLGEILEDIGRIVVRDVHVPPPVAAHDVNVAAGPAIAAARGDETGFMTIMKAACAVNDIWLSGQTATINGTDSPSQRDEILNEANQLHVTSSATVAVLCTFKTK